METATIQMMIVQQDNAYILVTMPDKIVVKRSQWKQRIETEIYWIKRWLPSHIILQVDDTTK